MKKIIIVFSCLCLLLFNICCKKKTIHLGKEINFESQENISYGNDPEQTMDLYIPAVLNSKSDVFIMIHGGGWRSGNKSQLTFFTLSMMQKFPKAVFANINYRLASTSRFGIPNQTEDINNVIHYLEKTLKYKPRFFLLGNSAGGHLSMLYAYHFDRDKKVKAVINIVGPSDLSDSGFKKYFDYPFVEKHLIDPKTILSNVSMTEFSSPVNWIRTTSAPTLSYYGKNDQVIPLSQKVILDSILNKNHILHESYEFNGGHLDWDKENNSSFLINKVDQFIKDLDKNKTL
ncbi:acetylesterase [Chryseobacterium sp. T16E-39]|uniref:alpha/beta hydrolase n=1 Tax=Chryseobacterium sp. T16E-39 TaxID=2015076 RepID=UPI000B5B2061|nr:alpha/beta hydrolase [Chryseobacterium sp. T16E-39]ASK31685.1 acetylesterase [Chryseobacterium sp. T16E-39]